MAVLQSASLAFPTIFTFALKISYTIYAGPIIPARIWSTVVSIYKINHNVEGAIDLQIDDKKKIKRDW